MNFKKTIAKSLVVAMALGMVPMANLESARAAAPTDIKLTATGIVTSATAKYWGIAKEVKKAGKDTIKLSDKNYKVTNIQEYPEVGIDAATAFKGKAGIIVTGTTAVTDSTNWIKLDLPAADKSFKVQYVAKKAKAKGLSAVTSTTGTEEFGYLVGTKVVNRVTQEVTLGTDVEAKLNDGNWDTVANVLGADTATIGKKLKMATQSGSTFTFRIKGTDKSFASNDAKVKITPQAKGPSVKFDVTRDTIAVKKGMDWQVVEYKAEGTAPDVAKWEAAESATKSMAIGALKVGGKSGTELDKAKNYVIFVRSSATDKKIASHHSSVTLNARPKALKFKNDKIDADGAEIQDSTNAVVGYIKSALAYDLKKGAVLTNTSKEDWEYALSKDEPKKWSTLKASKDVKKPFTAKIKYSDTEKVNTFGWKGAKLYLRVAGTKQTKDGVATLAGIAVDKEVKLTKIEQKLTIENPVVENVTENANDLAKLTLKYKVATGTAAKITVDGTITNVVKADVAPKVKIKTGSPKVSVKSGKVSKEGKFSLTFDISKSLFKKPEDIKSAEFNLKFEGLDTVIKLELTKKE